jgi:plasmid stabilization system protein ParE
MLGMEYEVVLTAAAEADFEAIIDYLESNAYHSAAEKLTKTFYRTLLALRRFPLQYPAVQGDLTLRRAVLNSKTIMFYRVADSRIVVTAIVDARRDRA